MRVRYATWCIVAFVTLLRGFAAWKVPLTGDEAYYWEWAKHLALGYADHPPMVAYLIVPFDWATANPLFVRLGFLLCGVVATLAAAGAAKRITGDERAGMVTALAMTLAPMLSVGFVLATPDGPLMAGWALCLYFAVRASQTHARRDYVLLGIAVAFALLSKMFAWALIAGIVAWALAPNRRAMWREGLSLSFVVAAVLYAPFLVWNAQHHWISFVFTLSQRHVSEPLWYRPIVYLAVCAAGYSPGLWIAALFVLVRPRNALVAWTAIPLAAVLILLNAHERIELHWFFGPYVSLAVGMGVAFEDLTHRARVLWATAGAVPAVVLIPFLFLAAAFPGQLYSQFRATGSTLRNSGPFEIFTYWPLAQDVKRMADANDAVVVTDGYGFSSQMDFEAGIPPVVIGYDHQGQESRNWYDAEMRPRRILFVDKEPLVARPEHPEDKGGRPDFYKRFEAACGEVRAGPTLGYSYTDPTGHSVPARTYFLTWCDDPRPNAIRYLRWEDATVTTARR
ncbi:MAG TPA: glycosyltransferase family 39 protein [Candidatus Elarobacter sp.]|jgi:4-amino-4-deoxy-L-arabinose transferase-like glycosyltransferase|nr:glycosyltransferase family 39 protein [Candidatus Elarobacter sp.]